MRKSWNVQPQARIGTNSPRRPSIQREIYSKHCICRFSSG
jgi:hypothetical protein